MIIFPIHFRASGEAILGTQRYLVTFFPTIFRSRVPKEFSRERAWQENRLGFRSPNSRKRRKKDKKNKKKWFLKMTIVPIHVFCRASGKAILGTQRYLVTFFPTIFNSRVPK